MDDFENDNVDPFESYFRELMIILSSNLEISTREQKIRMNKVVLDSLSKFNIELANEQLPFEGENEVEIKSVQNECQDSLDVILKTWKKVSSN